MDVELPLPTRRCYRKGVIRLQSCARDHAERLGISIDPGRIEVEFLVALLDQMLGPTEPFGSCAAAFHFRGGQLLDVIDISIGSACCVEDAAKVAAAKA